DVGDRVVGRELLRRQRTMQVVDRNIRARCCELAVDAPDVTFQGRSQAAVFGDVIPAWHGYLQEGDLGAQVLASLEQRFYGEQPLHDSLGVVQPINAQQQNPS